jgi:2-polyprenyl-3-methyl-5-hydroxy-6-metoxy-1,4-benzoquinol methylase
MMLAAHLDVTSDAASRNRNTIKKTVKWINSMIPPQARILDLGCGPGLYAEEFALRGHSVTGIDISNRSIDYAKQHAQEAGLTIDYYSQDYLSAPLKGKYDVIHMTGPRKTTVFRDFNSRLKNQ